MLVVLYGVVIIVGIFCNLFVIVVVWKMCIMYMVMNYLFVNLVFSDIFVLLWCFCIYDFVVIGLFFKGIIGDYLCRFFIVDLMDILCFGVILFILIVLVVEWY